MDGSASVEFATSQQQHQRADRAAQRQAEKEKIIDRKKGRKEHFWGRKQAETGKLRLHAEEPLILAEKEALKVVLDPLLLS